MNNVLLGKTIKAMYKLSGKTIAQLSDETELTVDTINNLFYARIQKPGLSGVCTLVKAMGFQPEELIRFMDSIEGENENADITERFTTYIASVRDAEPSAEPAKAAVPPAKKAESTPVNEQIAEGFRAQIEQLRESGKELSAHFERSIAGLKLTHEKETAYLKGEIDAQKKTNRRLAILLGCTVLLLLSFLFVDAMNHNIGWFR